MDRFFAQADELLKSPSMARIFELTGENDQPLYSERRLSDGTVERTTYAEMKAMAYAAGAAIAAVIDAPQGSLVGLKLKNCPRWAAIFWGILMAGYVPLLLDAAEKPLTTGELLVEAGAKAIITEDRPTYGRIPCIAPDSLAADAAAFVPRWADAAAFCSSGTTKRTICIFDGRALAHQINAARSMPAVSETVMYPASEGTLKVAALLPFHHIFGFVAVLLWYGFFGRTIVFFDSLAIDAVRRDCRELGVTHIFCIPMLFDGIREHLSRYSKHAKNPVALRLRRLLIECERDNPAPLGGVYARLIQNRLFGTKVRMLITGGACIAPRTLRFINALGYPLHNGYGLTEAGVTSVELSPDPILRTDGAAGAPLYGVSYELRDGEIFIDSPFLHIATVEGGAVIPRPAGPFATGDTGELTDGRLTVTGRSKDIIIGTAGENVRPEELEVLLGEVPHVVRGCVLGLADGKGGEKIAYAAELDAPLTKDSLSAVRDRINEVNASLPAYKRIREIHVPPMGIPTTGTRKIRKQELRAILENSRHAAIPLSPPMDGFKGLLANTTDATRAEVRALFARALNLPPDSIADDADFIFDLDGDSFTYVMLIDLFERRFELTLPPQLYTRFNTVNDFAALADNRDALNRLGGDGQ